MKNIFSAFLVLVTIFTANQVYSQLCYTTVFPWPGMTKITTNQSALSSPAGEAFWICSGVTVNVVNSAGSLFVCEENVTMIFTNTSGDDVFAKNGCSIINNSPGDVAVQCDTTQVTLQNNASGTIVVTSHCPTLTYDYTLVGGNSCQGTNGLTSNLATDNTLNVYPNPAKDYFSIVSESLKNSTVTIYSSSGQKLISLLNYKSGELIPLKELDNGMYWFELTDENFIGFGKLLVNN
jgi:hypothetical protein